jgi:hypothetical protein
VCACVRASVRVCCLACALPLFRPFPTADVELATEQKARVNFVTPTVAEMTGAAPRAAGAAAAAGAAGSPAARQASDGKDGPKLTIFGKTLEWNLQICIVSSLFDDQFAIRKGYACLVGFMPLVAMWGREEEGGGGQV